MMRSLLTSKVHLAPRGPIYSGTSTLSCRLAGWQTTVHVAYPNDTSLTSFRSFTYNRRFQKDGGQSRDFAIREEVSHKQEPSDSLRPETIQKPDHAYISAKEAPRTDLFLSEQTVSNKEQRKADWAILKEMSKYLWPKVRQ